MKKYLWVFLFLVAWKEWVATFDREVMKIDFNKAFEKKIDAREFAREIRKREEVTEIKIYECKEVQ